MKCKNPKRNSMCFAYAVIDTRNTQPIRHTLTLWEGPKKEVGFKLGFEVKFSRSRRVVGSEFHGRHAVP